MKKIIAIAAIIATSQASAFMDSGNGQTNGTQNGTADFAGNGAGEGEATFSMTFKGRGKSAGDFKGNGTTDLLGRMFQYKVLRVRLCIHQYMDQLVIVYNYQ